MVKSPAYAQDTEILLWAYAIDDDEVRVWDLTESRVMPANLEAALADPKVLCVAHNAMFDFTVLGHTDIHVPFARRYCTMVQALAHSLPGSLGQFCGVMGIASQDTKHASGRNLVHLFCKPRPKNHKLRKAIYSPAILLYVVRTFRDAPQERRLHRGRARALSCGP